MPYNPFDDLSTDASAYGEFEPYKRKPLSRLTSPIALEAPPQYKRDVNGDALGAFFATLGGLLGGNREAAGQFGASFLQGRQAGRERNYQRDVQQWQNKRSNDIYANQQDVARTQMGNAITQQENNAARQDWMDNRTIAGDERQARERERMVPVQANQNAERVLGTLRNLEPESAQNYLNSLDTTGQLKALGIDGFFARGADGRLTVPLPRINNAQSLNSELSFLKAGLSNRYATPETRSTLLQKGLGLLGGRGARPASPSPFSLPPAATTTSPEVLGTPQPSTAQAQQPEPQEGSTGFYGMTPYEQAQFRVKQEQLRQGAARVDVAQKNLQTRKAQVQQQGNIANRRLSLQEQQGKERLRLGWANYQKKGTSGDRELDTAFRDYGKIVAAQNRAYGIKNTDQRNNALADVDQMKGLFAERYPNQATLLYEPSVPMVVGGTSATLPSRTTLQVGGKPAPAPQKAPPAKAPTRAAAPAKAPAPAPKLKAKAAPSMAAGESRTVKFGGKTISIKRVK